MRSVLFDSATRTLRRYHGTGECDNPPVEVIHMGSNCTKVGARAYTLQSVSDHYVVSNYHPFKVKYDFDSACRGTITQLWSYDGCFERSRLPCH